MGFAINFLLRKEFQNGERNSLAVMSEQLIDNFLTQMEKQMQTEIEILETRETPEILWY